MAATFVTTLDNPYDFWTNFDEWDAFDKQKGYNTCAYLARIAKTSTQMSDADYEQALNEAVDEICRINLTGNYVKTVQMSYDDDDGDDDNNNDSEVTKDEINEEDKVFID